MWALRRRTIRVRARRVKNHAFLGTVGLGCTKSRTCGTEIEIKIRSVFFSSQVNTLPKAKSESRSKQNKDMHKCSSVYSERGVPLPVLTSGGE
jgi:hypothetical protein